ncbi:MAG: MgtC/SapB family protein [Gammaproteobacteria bacterium]|nr:MgtC/SapB family protein [Gammaproteobacteria bacterium]
MDALLDIAPLAWREIFTAIAAGTIVGFERQVLGKPAGIRTSCLICLGTYVFVAMSAHIQGDNVDSTRVIGQVVTGIGFLGAGVMLARDGHVMGVTSAAVIWMLAAIGVMIGLGHDWTAIKMAVLTVAILVGVDLLESLFKTMRQGVHAPMKYRLKKDDPS